MGFQKMAKEDLENGEVLEKHTNGEVGQYCDDLRRI